MALDPVTNFGYSNVATAPDPATTGTSLVVDAGEGVRFPTTEDGDFNVVVWSVGVQPNSANAEIVRVSARSTDTFTIVREQEGTSARIIVVGDQVALAPTKKFRDDTNTHIGSDGSDHSKVGDNETAIALNTTHSGSDGSDHSKVGANETAIALNTTHSGSDGSDHSHIDQDVKTSASPTFAGLTIDERSSDPDDPVDGKAIIWMSDGTESGEDGDILIKITVGESTVTRILFNYDNS